MSFVVVDLGNSETRFASDSGKVTVVGNEYIFLPLNEVVELKKQDDDNILLNLDVTIKKLGNNEGNSIFPTRILAGELAGRYKGARTAPSVALNKTAQSITYVTAILAAALSRLSDKKLSENITLYLALPPAEVAASKEIAKEALIGKYLVEFNRVGKSITVEIDNVACFEESYMALVAYIFENGVKTERGKQVQDGYTLLIDIGAGTTNISANYNGKYLDKSGKTFKRGGALIKDAVKEFAVRNCSFELPSEVAEKAVQEGRLRVGNSFVSVEEVIVRAKKDLARELSQDLLVHLQSIGVPVQALNAIILSGGGSLTSQYEDGSGVVITSQAMAEYLLDELKKHNPSVRAFSWGENARSANILGLWQVAKMHETHPKA